MARGLLGRRHSLFFRHNRAKALKEADIVILAGVPCDFRLNYGLSITRKARVVALNRSEHNSKMNRRPTIGIIAESRGDALALADAERTWRDRSEWLATLRGRDEERERGIAAKEQANGELVNPIYLLRTVRARSPMRRSSSVTAGTSSPRRRTS